MLTLFNYVNISDILGETHEQTDGHTHSHTQEGNVSMSYGCYGGVGSGVDWNVVTPSHAHITYHRLNPFIKVIFRWSDLTQTKRAHGFSFWRTTVATPLNGFISYRTWLDSTNKLATVFHLVVASFIALTPEHYVNAEEGRDAKTRKAAAKTLATQNAKWKDDVWSSPSLSSTLSSSSSLLH